MHMEVVFLSMEHYTAFFCNKIQVKCKAQKHLFLGPGEIYLLDLLKKYSSCYGMALQKELSVELRFILIRHKLTVEYYSKLSFDQFSVTNNNASPVSLFLL